MKTEVTSFGFEILVTYLLPGTLATGAVTIAHNIKVLKKLIQF